MESPQGGGVRFGYGGWLSGGLPALRRVCFRAGVHRCRSRRMRYCVLVSRAFMPDSTDALRGTQAAMYRLSEVGQRLEFGTEVAMTLQERDAYREKLTREFAAQSAKQSRIIADREMSGSIMVGEARRPRIIKRGLSSVIRSERKGVIKGEHSQPSPVPEVHERGWNGVPQNMPANVYPTVRVRVR